MRSPTLVVVRAALAATLAACGGDKPAADTGDALSQLSQAANQFANQLATQAQTMTEGTAGAGDRKPVLPVSFKVLMDYLPKSIDGMTAHEPQGETASIAGGQYSEAKAAFSSEDGSRSAEVAIFDYAHIAMLYTPYRMMLNLKVNRESTRGYERTVELDGFPAFEKWENAGADSEIAVMVGDRFVVTVNTNGMDEGAARKIVEGLDLKGLAKQTAG